MPIKTFIDLPQSTALSGAEIFAIVQGGTTKQITASATNFVSSSYFNNIVKLTQAEYDAIITPDPNTLYVITI